MWTSWYACEATRIRRTARIDQAIDDPGLIDATSSGRRYLSRASVAALQPCRIPPIYFRHAGVAQLAEQLIRNQ